MTTPVALDAGTSGPMGRFYLTWEGVREQPSLRHDIRFEPLLGDAGGEQHLTAQHEIGAALSARLEPHGFDVLGAASVGAYNRTLDTKLAGFRLPDLGDERNAVIVIGNTHRLLADLVRDAHCVSGGRRASLLGSAGSLSLPEAAEHLARNHLMS